jgi:hypothetical protein
MLTNIMIISNYAVDDTTHYQRSRHHTGVICALVERDVPAFVARGVERDRATLA